MAVMSSGIDAENTMRTLQSASVKRLFHIPKEPTASETDKKKTVTLDVVPWKPILITVSGPIADAVSKKPTYAYIQCAEADNHAPDESIFVASRNSYAVGNAAILVPTTSRITLQITYTLISGSLYIYQ